MALLLCLVAAKRWLSRHLYGLGLLVGGSHDVAMLSYFLLLLPGVLVHELSHWLAAKLLRVPTGPITIGPSSKGKGATRLGSVSMDRADPVREGIIGLAPLITGSVLILAIAYQVFGLSGLPELVVDLNPGVLLWTFQRYLSVPNLWLWVYLIFSISNAMLPSESDRQAWLSLALYCCLTAVVLYGFGLLGPVSSPLSSFLLKGLHHLTFAFLLTIIVDGGVIGLVAVVERVVMVVTGRRVDY